MRRAVLVKPTQGIIHLICRRRDSRQVKRLVGIGHVKDLEYISHFATPVLVEPVGAPCIYIGEGFVQIGHGRVVEIRGRIGVAGAGREPQLVRNELKVPSGGDSVICIGGVQMGARITPYHKTRVRNNTRRSLASEFISADCLVVISQAQGDPLKRPPAHIRPGRPAFIVDQTEGGVIKIVVEEREIEGEADIIHGEHLGYKIDLVPFVVSRVEFVLNHLPGFDLHDNRSLAGLSTNSWRSGSARQ